MIEEKEESIKIDIVLSQVNFERVEKYLKKIQKNPFIMGIHLSAVLSESDLEKLTAFDLIDALLKTAEPLVFAESLKGKKIFGESKWSKEEAVILGSIGKIIPVHAYVGKTYQPTEEDIYIHNPWPVTLLFTNGALLSGLKVDAEEVGLNNDQNEINFDNYQSYFESRLIPLLAQANYLAKNQEKTGIITIPMLGAGYFAGHHLNQVKDFFPKVIKNLLDKYKDLFPFIEEIILDKFSVEPPNELAEPIKIGNILFTETASSTLNKSLLKLEKSENTHILFSVVAGDHFSFPGNDGYRNSCKTQEGGVCMRTDIYTRMTGTEGEIASTKNEKGIYLPKSDQPNKPYWHQFCTKNLGINNIVVLIGVEEEEKTLYIPTPSYSPVNILNRLNGEIHQQSRRIKTPENLSSLLTLPEHAQLNANIEEIFNCFNSVCEEFIQLLKQEPIPFSKKERILLDMGTDHTLNFLTTLIDHAMSEPLENRVWPPTKNDQFSKLFKEISKKAKPQNIGHKILIGLGLLILITAILCLLMILVTIFPPAPGILAILSPIIAPIVSTVGSFFASLLGMSSGVAASTLVAGSAGGIGITLFSIGIFAPKKQELTSIQSFWKNLSEFMKKTKATYDSEYSKEHPNPSL